MKAALPPTAKLSKDAKECIQECVSELISFITSEAAEKCRLEKRKTLNGEDVLDAFRNLGFENYAEALRIYLAKYRQNEMAEHGGRKPKERTRDRPGVRLEDALASSPTGETDQRDSEFSFDEMCGEDALRAMLDENYDELSQFVKL